MESRVPPQDRQAPNRAKDTMGQNDLRGRRAAAGREACVSERDEGDCGEGDVMRWILKPGMKPGTTRTRYEFLFLPKRIDREIRWLEMAAWEEKAERWMDPTTASSGIEWRAVKWLP